MVGCCLVVIEEKDEEEKMMNGHDGTNPNPKVETCLTSFITNPSQ